MQNHLDHAEIQQQSCSILWNLCLNNDPNRISIANAGGIISVIAAMNSHVNNVGVQEKACGALSSLSLNNDANRLSIANAGGIISVIAAMNNHASTRQHTSDILKRLARCNAAYKKEIKELLHVRSVNDI